MSSANQPSLPAEMPNANDFSFAVISAEWNTEITARLKEGALRILKLCGAAAVTAVDVPGSFELSSAASLAASTKKFDAIICLGCIVQGETRHFEFICAAVANGLTNVAITNNIPVIFGVLTTDTLLQAHERAGGIHGNKGEEAAIAAVKMAALKKNIMQDR
jgi:6,7-dimethyl-8-ribityllumazine synthase